MKKFANLISIFVILLSVFGFTFGIMNFIDSKDDENTKTYEIIVEDKIDVFEGEIFDLSPVLIDEEGVITESFFKYSCTDPNIKININVGSATISINKLPLKNIELVITEEYTGTEAKVILCPVRDLLDILSVRDDNGTLVSSKVYEMEIGSSYAYTIGTLPRDYEIEPYVAYEIYDLNGIKIDKTVFNVEFNKNIIKFNTFGLGKGQIGIYIKNESQKLDFNQIINFDIKITDESIYNSLTENGSKLLAKEDISKVKKLYISDEVKTVNFDGVNETRFTNLEAIVFKNANEVVEVSNDTGLREDIYYRVSDKLLKDYMDNPYWSEKINYVIPYENNEYDTVYIVCHQSTIGLSSGLPTDSHEIEDIDIYAFDEVFSSFKKEILGYTFKYWEDYEGNKFASGDINSLKEGIHLYAIRQANTYKIIFEDYDEEINRTLDIVFDENVSTIFDDIFPSEKEGYVLDGWYLDETFENELVEELKYIYPKDITVFAKYVKNIKVHDLDVTDDIQVVYNRPIVLNNLSETKDWNFETWYYEKGKNIFEVKSGDIWKVEKPSTDIYSLRTYDISLAEYYNTFFNDLTSLKVVYGKNWNQSKKLLSDLLILNQDLLLDVNNEAKEKEWSVDGWYSSKDYNISSKVLLEEKVFSDTKIETLYPKLLTNVYFESEEINKTITAYYGESKNLLMNDIVADFKLKTGYTFMYWEKDNQVYDIENCMFILSEIEDGANTFEAKYRNNEYYINFNLNGGTGNIETLKMLYDVDGKLSETKPVKIGYEFINWKYNDKTYNAGATIEENLSAIDGQSITFVAQYSANQYQVKFKSVVLDSEEIVDCVYDENVNILNLNNKTTKIPGYVFVGWSMTGSNMNGENVNYYLKDGVLNNLSSVKNDVVILYDVWEPIKYVIQFDIWYSNTIIMDDITKSYAEDNYVLPSFDRDGYDFVGWECSDGNYYYAGDKLAKPTSASTIILTPEFTAKTYTITLVKDYFDKENSVYGEPINQEYGKSITGLDVVTRDGYVFKGWMHIINNEDGSIEYRRFENGNIYNIAENVTLYAMFEGELNVNYDINNDENSYIKQKFIYGMPLSYSFSTPNDNGNWKFYAYYSGDINGEYEFITGDTIGNDEWLDAKVKTLWANSATLQYGSVNDNQIYEISQINQWYYKITLLYGLTISKSKEILESYSGQTYNVLPNSSELLVTDNHDATSEYLDDLGWNVRWYESTWWFASAIEETEITNDSVLMGADLSGEINLYPLVYREANIYKHMGNSYSSSETNGTQEVYLATNPSHYLNTEEITYYNMGNWCQSSDESINDNETTKVTLDMNNINYILKYEPINVVIKYHTAGYFKAAKYGELVGTLSNDSKEGYNFNCYLISGTNISFSSSTLLDSSIMEYAIYDSGVYSISLTSDFEIKQFKVTISPHSATSLTVKYGNTSKSSGEFYVDWGTTLTITVAISNNNYENAKVKIDNNTYSSGHEHTVKNNVTIGSTASEKPKEDEGGGGCFVKGSLIMMADGSQKKVEDVVLGEEIFVFNHDEGRLDTSPISYIFYEKQEYINVLYVTFSDGTTIGVCFGHGFFDIELNKYVIITPENVEEYMNHHYYKYEYIDGEYVQKVVQLVKYEIKYELVECYSVASAIHINHVVNGMLAVTDDIEGLYNFFEFDENMKYNEELKQADIEKYGLYEYSDWSDYITYEQFIAFNVPYIKVALGKGLVDYETLLEYIELYLSE